jgi:MFS family permease
VTGLRPPYEPPTYRLPQAAFDFLPAFLLDGLFYLVVFTLTHHLDAAGYPTRDVAMVLGLYSFTYCVLAATLGRTSDRGGANGRRRSLIGAGLLITALPLLLAAAIEVRATDGELEVLSRVPLSLRTVCYVGVAAFGLSNALFWPAFQARMGDRYADADVRGRAIRTFNLGWTSGKASGFLAGGLVYAWSPAACLPAAGLAGGLVLILQLLDRRPGEGASSPAPSAGGSSGSSPAGLSRAVKQAFLLSALAANFAVWGAMASLQGLSPQLERALGLEEWQVGLLLFSALAAQGVGFFALGRPARWAYRPHLLLAALPVSVASLLVLAATNSVPLAGAAVIAIGLAQAATYAASIFYSLDYDEHRGLRTGIHETVLALGAVIPAAGGWIADATGYERAYLVFVAGVDGLALLLVVVLLARARSGRA